MVPAKQEASIVVTQQPDFAPARIVELEIGQPLPMLSSFDEKTGRDYQRALCLVRLHSQPLGVVEFQLDESGLSAHAYTEHIWRMLSAKINEHLRQDGLPPVTGLDPAGLSSSTPPRCSQERERFLAEAPFVSVIVPTHDRPEQLQACLRSLLALHYPHYEVIIVDNAPSTHATAELIQQIARDVPWVRYLREDRPGVSWGRNRGIKAAKGEILAFTDDDVVVDAHWLVELVKGFSLADNVACVTGLILPLELETPAQFWIEMAGGYGKGFTRRIFDMKENRPKIALYPYHTGHFGTGASMALKASFLHSVGGFDPALGGSGPVRCGQDIAAFFQVIIRGYKLVYEPAALLYHLGHRDYAGLRRLSYNYGVGLISHLMKCVLDNPRLLFDFLPKVPYGLFLVLQDRFLKQSKKATHSPRELRELSMIELKGMLYGPLAYLQSRWATRDARKAFTAIEASVAPSAEPEEKES
jgi:GT2 family glycosyltransferase